MMNMSEHDDLPIKDGDCPIWNYQSVYPLVIKHAIENPGEMTVLYTLWLFNVAMEAMALIEIDDFPSERNLHLWLGFSMANC